MSIRGRGAQAEAVAFDDAEDGIQRGEARGRARSVPRAPELPLALPLRVVTPRDAAERAKAAAARVAAVSSAVQEGRHWTGQLKSMQDARARVHEAASGHNALLMKWSRVADGYLFLLLKALLNLIEVAWEEPAARFLIVLVIVLAIWFR